MGKFRDRFRSLFIFLPFRGYEVCGDAVGGYPELRHHQVHQQQVEVRPQLNRGWIFGLDFFLYI